MKKNRLRGSELSAAEKAHTETGGHIARQAIADAQSTPEFQENYERLRRERHAREAAAKALKVE